MGLDCDEAGLEDVADPGADEEGEEDDEARGGGAFEGAEETGSTVTL